MSKPHICRMGGRWYAGTRQAPDLRTHAATPRRALELLGFYRHTVDAKALRADPDGVWIGGMDEPLPPPPKGFYWEPGKFGFRCMGDVRQDPPRLVPLP